MAFFFGSVFGDTFDGGADNDIFLTREGIDRITTGGGFDLAFTGDDDDTLIAGSGFKIFSGGGGVDFFGAEATASGKALILDFSGGDRIDVSNFGIESIEDLTIISTEGGDASVRVGGFVFELRGVAADDLGSDDFIFAENENLFDFEDLSSDTNYFGPMPGGYFGFDWSNFFFTETDENPAINGYVAPSGENIIACGNTGEASISSVDDFELVAATMGAGWNDGLQITIEGFLDGESTGTQVVVILDAATAQQVDFDDAVFDQVDRVEFTAEGGIKNDTFGPGGGLGLNFWMDLVEIA